MNILEDAEEAESETEGSLLRTELQPISTSQLPSTDQQQHSNTQPRKNSIVSNFFPTTFRLFFWNAQKQNCSFRIKEKINWKKNKTFSTFFASRKQKKNEGKIFFSTIFRRRLFLILIKQKFVI